MTLKQFGVEVRFVAPSDPENFPRAADGKLVGFDVEIAKAIAAQP